MTDTLITDDTLIASANIAPEPAMLFSPDEYRPSQGFKYIATEDQPNLVGCTLAEDELVAQGWQAYAKKEGEFDYRWAVITPYRLQASGAASLMEAACSAMESAYTVFRREVGRAVQRAQQAKESAAFEKREAARVHAAQNAANRRAKATQVEDTENDAEVGVCDLVPVADIAIPEEALNNLTEQQQQWLKPYLPIKRVVVVQDRLNYTKLIVEDADGNQYHPDHYYHQYPKVGDHGYIHCEAGRKSGQFYYYRPAEDVTKPIPDSELAAAEVFSVERYISDMERRKARQQKEDNFLSLYKSLFGETRVRRVTITAINKNTGNPTVVDEHGNKTIALINDLGTNSRWRSTYKHNKLSIGDKGLIWDSSIEANKPYWKWESVDDPQKGATDEEFQKLHQEQFQHDMQLDFGEMLNPNRKSRNRGPLRPIRDVANRDKNGLSRHVLPKVVYQKCYRGYDTEKKEAIYEYYQWEVEKITDKLIYLDANYSINGSDYSTSYNKTKVRLNRQDLSHGRTATWYSVIAGLSLSFVLYRPGEEPKEDEFQAPPVSYSERTSLLEILGLSDSDDSEEKIKSAYRLLTRENHPDVVEADKKDEAHEFILKLNDAYEKLMRTYREARNINFPDGEDSDDESEGEAGTAVTE